KTTGSIIAQLDDTVGNLIQITQLTKRPRISEQFHPGAPLPRVPNSFFKLTSLSSWGWTINDEGSIGTGLRSAGSRLRKRSTRDLRELGGKKFCAYEGQRAYDGD